MRSVGLSALDAFAIFGLTETAGVNRAGRRSLIDQRPDRTLSKRTDDYDLFLKLQNIFLKNILYLIIINDLVMPLNDSTELGEVIGALVFITAS